MPSVFGPVCVFKTGDSIPGYGRLLRITSPHELVGMHSVNREIAGDPLVTG